MIRNLNRDAPVLKAQAQRATLLGLNIPTDTPDAKVAGMLRVLVPRSGASASELEAERDREWLEQFAETVRLIERGHKLTRAEAERHTVLLDPAPHGPGMPTPPRKVTKARRAEPAPAESKRDSSAPVSRQARKRQRPRLTITADHFDDDDFE